jgi:hypothetical protein
MKEKKLKPQQPVAESHEDMTAMEKWFETVKPYGSMIALVIAVCFLAFIAMIYLIQANEASKEAEWRQLNVSISEMDASGNSNVLKQVAEEFPEGKAGMWALQIAGDYDLRTGIRQLSYDRDGGLKLVEKAKESFQGIVDAPATAKSTMLQRRSIFSLAYANESLGNFDSAKTLYQQIVDEAPDTVFAEAAARGAVRCTNPQFVALYEKFKTYEDLLGDAPGPAMTAPPDISFPEIDGEASTGGGGEFGSITDEDSQTETTEVDGNPDDSNTDTDASPLDDSSDDEN